MCTVSMVMDHYQDKWQPWKDIIESPIYIPPYPLIPQPQITPAELQKLREDIAELKKLLKRAKKYDEDNGEKDCELSEKVEAIRKITKLVGEDLDDVVKITK